MTNYTRAEIEKLLTDTRSDAGCGFGECQKDAMLTHLLTQIDALREALGLYGSKAYHAGKRDDCGYTKSMLRDLGVNRKWGRGKWSGKTARKALAQTEHLKR